MLPTHTPLALLNAKSRCVKTKYLAIISKRVLTFQAAKEHTGCIPWYLPQNEDVKMCDPWRTKSFLKEMEVG